MNIIKEWYFKKGLIIIDFLGTALIPYILSLKVPVVLYLKDKSLINKLTFEDLTKRCYIADDPKELEELFYLYSEKKGSFIIFSLTN